MQIDEWTMLDVGYLMRRTMIGRRQMLYGHCRSSCWTKSRVNSWTTTPLSFCRVSQHLSSVSDAAVAAVADGGDDAGFSL